MSSGSQTDPSDPRPAQLHEFLVENCGGTYTAQARSIAKARLQAVKLPTDDSTVRKLVCEVHGNLLLSFRGNPATEPIENIAGYFSTSAANWAKSLLRAKRHRRDDVMLDPKDAEKLADESGPAGSNPRPFVDRYRSAVEQLGHNTDLVTVSTTLTFLTLLDCEDIEIVEVPVPRAGVAKSERLGWPALYIATHNPKLFASDAPSNLRRKRQRLLAKVSEFRAVVQHHLQMETAT